VQLGGIGAGTGATLRRRSAAASTPSEPNAAPPGRALVAVEAPAASERAAMAPRRPMAAFVAHLIATEKQVPQTRMRRRTEPAEAIATYMVAMAQPAAATGRILVRAT
jgi:hypothetical protein